MALFAGQGNVGRSMALLWRRSGATPVRTTPGPKPALSVDAVVDAAISLADADGIAAVSMRAVGERLGRSGMALYTYVQSKNELVDLMYDRALAELPAAYPQDHWRAALICWADDLCGFYLRHPWALQMSTARPVLGPHEYAMLNTVLGILYRTGLSSTTLRRAVGVLFHFVRGAAQTIAEARQAPSATGVSDDEWWASRSMMLEELAPDFAQRFPMVMRLEGARDAPADEPGMRHGGGVPHQEQEARETFQVGLTVLLDGIDAARARAVAEGPEEG
ncbi:TetR/AcrR family transcriptional regulator [Micromonospora sp. WMMD723]|uniref:TetR/AcrR family transcriptional regulator n=1 Tax=unclassified Micromonospora TaxID=2617518 RepID=UPI003B926A03